MLTSKLAENEIVLCEVAVRTIEYKFASKIVAPETRIVPPELVKLTRLRKALVEGERL